MPSPSHRLDQALRWIRNAAQSAGAVLRARTSPLAGRERLDRAADGTLRAQPATALLDHPRVVLDAVFFQLNDTGIARLWKALMAQWSASGLARHVVALDRDGTAPRHAGFTYRAMPPMRHHDSAAQRLALQAVCDAEQADVLLSTYYTTGGSTPSIMYVYDMIPEVMGFDLNAPMWRDKRRAVEHASAYIAISQSTAEDLVRFYPQAATRPVCIAHCAADPIFTPASDAEVVALLAELELPADYVLFVGARDAAQKNAALVFEALAAIPLAERPALLCVGGAPELEAELLARAPEATVRVARLSDEQLRVAYSGARALVYPSRYEGFGLPLLEAMACGCPAVTCAVSAMPEVAGDAALYVGVDDAAGLAEAITRLYDGAEREHFCAAGFERAALFDWKKTADEVEGFVRLVAAATEHP